MKTMEEYRTRSSGISNYKKKFSAISQTSNSEKIIFRNPNKVLYKGEKDKQLYFPSNEKLRTKLRYGQ